MGQEERIVIYFIIGILLFTSMCYYGSYIHKELKINNFQETIKELSDEQKCMHIFDQYKFCLEKCDRISEREMACGN